MEKLGVRDGERVLEIGYGTGTSLVELARKVGSHRRVCGVDIADQMFDVAWQKLCNEHLEDRVERTCADAMTLPYLSDCMDAIFTSFTLELFDTPEISVMLAECRRVLLPGGRLVVISMSKEGKNGAIVHMFEWTHRHFPNFLDCRPIFVREAIQSAGFRIESADTKTMWVPVEVILGRKDEST